MAIPLTEPVFLRSSRDSCCMICLQDHSMLRLEAVGVCARSQFGRFRDQVERRSYGMRSLTLTRTIRCRVLP